MSRCLDESETEASAMGGICPQTSEYSAIIGAPPSETRRRWAQAVQCNIGTFLTLAEVNPYY